MLDADGYGVTDRLLEAASPALGPDGRAELRRLLQARLTALPRSRRSDEYGSWSGRGLVSFRLRELADMEGDADAFIAAAEVSGRVETLAGDIAERLIAHDRPAEALAWLERAPGRHEGEAIRCLDLSVAALSALGRRDEAQGLRWGAFSRWLSAAHLRPYLRALPDFDDVEAEDRAMEHALSHPDRNLALTFLVTWPNLEAANRLVRAHVGELEGRDYGRLRPAAEALAEKYPASATLLHRVLAEDLLPVEEGLESHVDFMARLKREHPRKTGIWSLLKLA
jgi:hypothetical protein